MEAQHRSLAEAEQLAASRGIRITPADREAIHKVQEAELKRLSALSGDASNERWFEAAFSRRYTWLLEALVWIGNILLTFSQTVIVSIGIPLVLVLLLIVEQQRVVHGILMFETDPALASFAASSLVMLNLVLEFQIHYIEQNAGYAAHPDTAFSLRLWLDRLAYILGIGHNWKPRVLSPATRYKQLLTLVTFSILALALAGSMKSVIDGMEGPWFEALLSILTQSDLSLILTWVGGLLFATAAVLSAQSLSRYVAMRCVEIMSSIAAAQTRQQQGMAQAVDEVGAQYVLAKIAAAQAKQTAHLQNGYEESRGQSVSLAPLVSIHNLSPETETSSP